MRKYLYFRITGTCEGKQLSYEDCLSYIESFQFLERRIPTAIVKNDKPKHGHSEWAVWVWKKEHAESFPNSEELKGDIRMSFFGFKELYVQDKRNRKI
jgi:hypothetical protein